MNEQRNADVAKALKQLTEEGLTVPRIIAVVTAVYDRGFDHGYVIATRARNVADAMVERMSRER